MAIKVSLDEEILELVGRLSADELEQLRLELNLPILNQVLQQLKTSKAKLEIEQAKNSTLEQELQTALQQVDSLKREVQTTPDRHPVASDVKSLVPVPPINAQVTVEPTSIQENLLSPQDKIALFRALFLGRPDAFAVRWESESTSGSGYQPARNHDYRAHFLNPKTQKRKCPGPPGCPDIPVSEEIVKHHLQGKHTIGTYALLPDDTCFFLSIDLDDKHVKSDRQSQKKPASGISNEVKRRNPSGSDRDRTEYWKDDERYLLSAARELGVPSYVERSRSGKGGHLWVFFEGPVLAAKARRLGEALIAKANQDQDQIRLSTYDRMFPNQDTMPERGYGNLIALPLQKQPLTEGNSAFLDENLVPHPDQWQFLQSVQRMPESSLESVIRKMGSSGELSSVPRPSKTDEGDDKVDPWALPPYSQDNLLRGRVR